MCFVCLCVCVCVRDKNSWHSGGFLPVFLLWASGYGMYILPSCDPTVRIVLYYVPHLRQTHGGRALDTAV